MQLLPRDVLRRDLDVERIGTMAELMADATMLQLGAEGVYRSTAFAVVGRVQVRYDDGGWNEWYLVFDDGRSGWLGEASGEYTMSFGAAVLAPTRPRTSAALLTLRACGPRVP